MTSEAPAIPLVPNAAFAAGDTANLPAGIAPHPYQRVRDLVAGAILLLCALPVMLAVAAAIYIEDGGTVLFVQTRVGRKGRSFPCLKFRSMRTGADRTLEALLSQNDPLQKEWQDTRKLRADPRITAVGAFIRKYSLDELPQFLNVLRGDMSLVGPRPIVPDETPNYGRRIDYYLAVRPGLTGLWQVRGRSDTAYRSRVAMDVIYARTRRLSMDLKILATTIPVVLRGRGSY